MPVLRIGHPCLKGVVTYLGEVIQRFLNRKRENRKWLIKALEDGPYVFRNITPTGSTIPRLQEEEDLQGDDLLYYDAEMELMNMILLSIPNEIYNSMDSCKTASGMMARVEYKCDVSPTNEEELLIIRRLLGSCVAIPCDLLVPNSIYKLIKVCVLRGGLLLS
ncbi:hypothetical protein Tco_0459463 [Tanacetum coccineum]